MERARVPIDAQRLDEICRKHHISRLSIFGSALRDDFRPDSDVDLLIEFEPEHSVGWEIVDVGNDLEPAFGGHRVDLVNPKYLNPRLRERILSSAKILYAAR